MDRHDGPGHDPRARRQPAHASGGRAMIAMPRRSVTRFFIPLIDVLLLLFCAFLLMPMVNQEELDKKTESAADLSETILSLEKELDRRNQDLAKFEELRPGLAELAVLRQEV